MGLGLVCVVGGGGGGGVFPQIYKEFRAGLIKIQK